MTRPVQRNLAASVKARLAARATAIEDVQHLRGREAVGGWRVGEEDGLGFGGIV